jgi:hypothetical protein
MDLKQRAGYILERIDYSPTHVHWGEHKHAAFELAQAIDGYKPKGANCLSCHLKVVNVLRRAIELPPIGMEATPEQHTKRLDICRGTDTTPRCEHLRWADLNCGVCGCFVDIKARFRKQHCPLGKW